MEEEGRSLGADGGGRKAGHLAPMEEEGRSLGADGGGRQVTWGGWRRRAGLLGRMEEEGRSLGADGEYKRKQRELCEITKQKEKWKISP